MKRLAVLSLATVLLMGCSGVAKKGHFIVKDPSIIILEITPGSTYMAHGLHPFKAFIPVYLTKKRHDEAQQFKSMEDLIDWAVKNDFTIIHLAKKYRAYYESKKAEKAKKKTL